MSLAGRDPEEAAVALEAAGFVLAGGRSSRMGADKALMPLAGQPLAGYALAALREAGLPVSIAGAHTTLGALAPVVEDSEPDRGPLGGICAALSSTSAHWTVFLPVDLPLLPASLVGFLLNHAKITGAAVTVPSVNGFAQTFPAVIDREALPGLKNELDAGRGGCFAAFQAAARLLGRPVSIVAVEPLLQCRQLAHPDALPATRWFLNVNRPQDLRRAETHLSGALRVI